MDLKYLILDNLWITKHEVKIIKNDITPPQKICVKELPSWLQDEENLSSSEKNLDEHFKKELNSCRTTMLSLHEELR